MRAIHYLINPGDEINLFQLVLDAERSLEDSMDKITIRHEGADVLNGRVRLLLRTKEASDMVIKDSGERTEFTSGAVRDMHEGKGRFDLLPMCALLRLARHYENGCKKYGDRNWEKGIPAHSFADSAMRHLVKYMDGQTDEDHLIAAAWNLLGLAWTEEKRPDMMDIPARLGQK